MNSDQLNNLNKPPKGDPLSKEEIKVKQAIRDKRECGCCGKRQNCNMCYGTGYYIVDGYGNYV